MVAVYDGLPSAIWVYQFLSSQGIAMKPIKMMQDNLSAIQIEKFGTVSCKRTKHMELRYFWISDHVGKGTVTPVYCPTKQMLADVLTKPLQGSLFKAMRDIILNR